MANSVCNSVHVNRSCHGRITFFLPVQFMESIMQDTKILKHGLQLQYSFFHILIDYVLSGCFRCLATIQIFFLMLLSSTCSCKSPNTHCNCHLVHPLYCCVFTFGGHFYVKNFLVIIYGFCFKLNFNQKIHENFVLAAI